MSLHSTYQTLWLPGVLRAQSGFRGGFRDWLVEKAWAPDSKLTGKRAVLAVFDSSELVDSLVNDFITLSTAAFESAASVSVRAADPRACAWQIISYYYSAYFSANAIMRLSGHLCTNLDSESCTEVNERALLYGLGGINDKTKLSPSVFYGSYDHGNSGNLVMSGLSGVRGGVHIQFWAGFLRFLDDIDKDIASSVVPTVDRKLARAELNRLRGSLTYSGRQNGSWLSDVRNAVNYRFENGVWYPYSDSRVTGHELRAALRSGVRGLSEILGVSTVASDCSRLVSVRGFLLRWIESSLSVIETKARHGKRKQIREGAMAFASVI